MSRKRPFRRYIYRDPDTGRELKLWRGEALDRVVKYAVPPAWMVFTDFWGEHSREAVLMVWNRDVRLRDAR